MSLYNMKGLVKRLKINDPQPNIEFYEYKSGKRQFLVYISCISDTKEQDFYESLSIEKKKNYISLSPKLYIPNLGIDNLIEEEQKVNPFGYERTINKINQLRCFTSGYQRMNGYCLYLFLHELGHYFDFVSYEMKPYVYIEQDTPLREKIHNERKNLEKLSFKERTNPSDIKRINEYFDRYESISSEKKANEYADKSFHECFNLIENI